MIYELYETSIVGTTISGFIKKKKKKKKLICILNKKVSLMGLEHEDE